MTKDSGQQPGDLRRALCTEPHFGRPEGVVTGKQAGVCGKPPGTAQGVCAHTPFHSPAFMPRTHHGQVALWIYSAALFEHLLYTTAHLNHSHSQPHAHHSPQTNPTHTVFSPVTPYHTHTPSSSHTSRTSHSHFYKSQGPPRHPTQGDSLCHKGPPHSFTLSPWLRVQVRQSAQT